MPIEATLNPHELTLEQFKDQTNILAERISKVLDGESMTVGLAAIGLVIVKCAAAVDQETRDDMAQHFRSLVEYISSEMPDSAGEAVH